MDYVIERERGKIPLSIGTSLAFESLIGIHDEVTHQPPLFEDNKVIYVNVKTLFRNLYGAINREHVDLTSDRQLATALMQEIDLIKDVCRNEAKGLDVVFYLPNYIKLDNINREVLLRLYNTSLQKKFTDRMTNTLRIVVSKHNDILREPTEGQVDTSDLIRVYDNKITDNDNRNAIIFTNYAYDLVSFRKFRRLILLESHTGKVKDRTEWYTKYYNGSTLPPMPLREDLLTILGDSTLFRCKVSAFKREIVRLAIERNWTPITTTSKIKEDISTIKNHEIRIRLLNCITGL